MSLYKSALPYLSLADGRKLQKLARNGLEDVEAVARRRDDHAGDLGVPVDLLDVLLALVDKEQLAGDDERVAVGANGRGGLVVVLLDTQVPQRDLVVRARRGEHGRVGRVPFHRGDGCRVPCKVRDGSRGTAWVLVKEQAVRDRHLFQKLTP